MPTSSSGLCFDPCSHFCVRVHYKTSGNIKTTNSLGFSRPVLLGSPLENSSNKSKTSWNNKQDLKMRQNTNTLYGSKRVWRLCRARQRRVLEWVPLFSAAEGTREDRAEPVAPLQQPRDGFSGPRAQLQSDTTHKSSRQVTVSPLLVLLVS